MEREIFEEVDQTELTQPAETPSLWSMIKSYPWQGWLVLIIAVALGVTLVVRHTNKRTDMLIKMHDHGKPAIIQIGPGQPY